MGGSSVPPQEIFNKFRKRRRTISDLERRQRFIDFRNQMTQLETCCARWEDSPVFAKSWADQLFAKMTKLARPTEREEPDQLRRMELADLLINKLVPLQHELTKRGWTPYAQELSRLLHGAYKEASRAERFRQGMPDVDTPQSLHDIDTKVEMLGYINTLLHEHRLEPFMAHHGYMTLKEKAEVLGVYLPPPHHHGRPYRTVKLVDEQFARFLRLKPKAHPVYHTTPSQYLLYDFQVPRSSQEEWNILHSPLFKRAYRKLARQWHPDTSSTDWPVQAFWWRVLQETHAALMNRKHLLGSRLVPIYHDHLEEVRSAEQLHQPEKSVRRGLALHE